MQGNFKAKEALALLTTTTVLPEVGATKLGERVAREFAEIPRVERMNASRAVLVGLGLHAVKASLQRGEFEAWKKANLTLGNIWSESTALKNASFYMRLAIAFVEQAKPSRQELLALTSSNLDLELGAAEAVEQKLMSRVAKFVGERSLNELLVDEGIKSTQGSASAGSKPTVLPADDDTLAEDAGQLLMRFDDVLLNPEHIKRFTAAQLDDMERQLTDRLAKFRELKAALLSPQS